MSKYKHIFFDLDRTLWDFESNSIITLREIHSNRIIGGGYDIDFDEFVQYYKKYNEHLWDLYKLGKVKKEYLRNERFRGTLKHFGIESEEIAEQVSQDYIYLSPRKTQLFPNSIEVLEILASKYELHIITNGFSEVQFIKLEKSGLTPYFTKVITSEMVGVQKPNPKVFEFSLEQAGAKVEESIMIGDDQDSDIKGAQSIGMDTVFVDYYKEELVCKPTHHVNDLKALLNIL
jgi:putative hydrolase of the HAD superfamily